MPHPAASGWRRLRVGKSSDSAKCQAVTRVVTAAVAMVADRRSSGKYFLVDEFFRVGADQCKPSKSARSTSFLVQPCAQCDPYVRCCGETTNPPICRATFRHFKSAISADQPTGLSNARNIGLREVTTPYIAFMAETQNASLEFDNLLACAEKAITMRPSPPLGYTLNPTGVER